MKSIFQANDAQDMIRRIQQLNEKSERQWGKMTVAQMMAHCTSFQAIPMGEAYPTRSNIGRLVGRLIKPMMYNDKPLPHNLSTIPTIIITEECNLESERQVLIAKIITFQQAGPQNCSMHPHPFFGKLTAEQWGMGIYKHLDHHLQQFNV